MHKIRVQRIAPLPPYFIYLKMLDMPLQFEDWRQYQQSQGMPVMPLITLKTNKGFFKNVADRLAEALSLITEKTLHKKKELIVVRFETIYGRSQWYIGGAIKSDDRAIFELNIIITKGTNTDEEKALWIAQAWEIVTEIFGNTSHPNYILIQEIDGKSWGYNGLSQEQRKIQST